MILRIFLALLQFPIFQIQAAHQVNYSPQSVKFYPQDSSTSTQFGSQSSKNRKMERNESPSQSHQTIQNKNLVFLADVYGKISGGLPYFTLTKQYILINKFQL